MDDELLIALQPVVASVGLELVDVERQAGRLLVTVDRPGGVDLDALTTANRAVSRALDDLDPIPGRYSLEVSSPGLERRLRTPAHFTRAVGETISVKTRPQVEGERRRRGRLVRADDDGFEIEPDEDGGAVSPTGAPVTVRFAYGDIDRARTVFEWGPSSRGGGTPSARANGPGRGGSGRTRGGQRGKQVVNR